MEKIIVTGGAGFIGRWFVQKAIKKYKVTILDKLTYSGNKANLEEFVNNQNYNFVHGDICDEVLVPKLFSDLKPVAIINFAAESHVDNSILGPKPFIDTNIVGTFNLLNSAKNYLNSLDSDSASKFRFVHISTDEVYGSLLLEESKFSRRSHYAPNSPYSASKAASDLLARAWFETYGVPVIITNCSNNYGPFQHEEKLIPKVITKALAGENIPIYGKGENIRDWIYVEDHAEAILLALEKGIVGQKYLFGGDNEMRNIDLVNHICDILQDKTGIDHKKQIKFVIDRQGHDFRYAIDSSEAKTELGFNQSRDFSSLLEKTVDWYMEKMGFKK